MSTKYYRLTSALEISDYSDYGRPMTTYHEEDGTITEYETMREITIGTAAETISLARYITLSTYVDLFIKNKDTTNYVTLTYVTVGGGATTQTMRIRAEKVVKLTDVDPNTDITLTANTAACEVVLSIFDDS